MNFSTPAFGLVLPELLVLGMACVILVVDSFLSERTKVVTFYLTMLTLLGAFILSLIGYDGSTQITFSGMFISDRFSHLLKIVVYLLSGACFVYARHYLDEQGRLRGEFFVVGLFCVLGMMVMISAYSFLTVYLGLELMSLSLYAMIALDRDDVRAAEASMKYFVLGAIASGMLLYGMSMIYGATGTLDLTQVAAYATGAHDNTLVLVFGTVFLMVGLAFKIGAVPFHMWLPDVYQGAPAPVTTLIGSAAKVAAFALFIRLLAEGLDGVQGDWGQMLVALSVLSLLIGNLFAIAQTNIKRMLAYSTIAHVGFIFLGLIAGTAAGYAAATFYTIIYTLMAAGAFGMVVFLSRKGAEAENLDDFAGLNERHPWFALLMLILMFSMAGVPPTAGFYAKLVVISAVLNAGYVWLAVFSVIMSVIGAFYYLRVIKLMYFDEAGDRHTVSRTWDFKALLSVNGVLLLWLGIFPNALMALCVHAM